MGVDFILRAKGYQAGEVRLVVVRMSSCEENEWEGRERPVGGARGRKCRLRAVDWELRGPAEGLSDREQSRTKSRSWAGTTECTEPFCSFWFY